jgi:dUTPase
VNLEIQRLNALAEEWFRKHDNDAGWDIPLPNADTIFPMASKVIPLGWAIAIPNNFVGLLVGRSST